MTKLFLDFETRSVCDIRACGAHVYARHPSTTVLCLAYQLPNSPTVGLWSSGAEYQDQSKTFWHDANSPPDRIPPELADCVANPHVELHAHNASFEKLIWRHVMVAKFGWPPVDDDRWHCTAARAAALALPRQLGDLGGALGVEMQKDSDGRRLMLKLSCPRTPTKNNPAVWHNSKADFCGLYKYCQQDVAAEQAIDAATRPLTDVERAVWLLDQRINNRGIPVDLASVGDALEVDRLHKLRLAKRLAKITGNQVETGQQVARMLAFLNRLGVNVADLKAETVERQLRLLHPPLALEVLRLRQQLSRSSVAKYQALANRTDTDGRFRGGHLYCGAATGRWAGQGVQMQNLPRGTLPTNEIDTAVSALRLRDPEAIETLYGNVSGVLSSLIRPMIRATRGRRFIVADFAGIEARVLAWLANERGLLDVFVRNTPVYEYMAGKIYGIEPEQVDKSQRQLGKVAILGLGYQMGAGKFQDTAEKFGVEIDGPTSKRVVNTYRDANPRIVRFWSLLDKAAKRAVVTGEAQTAGRILFHTSDRWLFCTLPSGRRIAYVDPEVCDAPTPWGMRPKLSSMGANSYTRQWERLPTYGGKLAENITQAVARDLLAAAMLRLDSMGHEIVLHVHDEIVIESDNGKGSLAEVCSAMSKTPQWAKDLPVAAEGFEAERYRK